MPFAVASEEEQGLKAIYCAKNKVLEKVRPPVAGCRLGIGNDPVALLVERG